MSINTKKGRVALIIISVAAVIVSANLIYYYLRTLRFVGIDDSADYLGGSIFNVIRPWMILCAVSIIMLCISLIKRARYKTELLTILSALLIYLVLEIITWHSFISVIVFGVWTLIVLTVFLITLISKYKTKASFISSVTLLSINTASCAAFAVLFAVDMFLNGILTMITGSSFIVLALISCAVLIYVIYNCPRPEKLSAKEQLLTLKSQIENGLITEAEYRNKREAIIKKL